MRFLIFALLVLPGFIFAQDSFDPFAKIAPERLIEDVDFYMKAVHEAHADPYRHISKEKLEKLAEAVKAEVRRKGAMNQKEFWVFFTPIVAALGDSHSMVIDPRFFIKNDPTKYFPIRARYIDGKFVVNRSFTDEVIPRGTIIKSINGLTTNQVLERLRNYRYGTIREKDDQSAPWLWVGMPEVFGHPDVFTVEFEGGKKSLLHGILLSEVIKRESAGGTAAKEPEADSPLSLTFLPDNIAYLKSTTFSYELPKYKELLNDVFKRINDAGSKNMIIDVRTNSGGNSALGDALTQMFTAKPYRHYSMKWKRSQQYVDEMARKRATLPDEYLKLKPGEFLSSDSATVTPGDQSHRFRHGVYILSSKETFSSAQMFLAVIKANGLATIVGEETNQPVCSTGEIFFFNLPNSRIRTSLSTKSFIPPGGCNGAAGVIPDIAVRTRVEDHRSGRDVILETALAKIKETESNAKRR